MRFCDDWLLLPERIAFHEPTATAIIADVHLGYTKTRQEMGDAIPSRSASDELLPLIKASSGRAIRRLVVAGDLFERNFDSADYEAFLEVLARLEIHWLGLAPGNHDRGAADAMPHFPDGYDLAGWRIIHGDQPCPAARTICGHWHPAYRRRGGKDPCYLTNASNLVLPAFSQDAAGGDVRTDPRWRGGQAWVIRDAQVIRAEMDDR